MEADDGVDPGDVGLEAASTLWELANAPRHEPLTCFLNCKGQKTTGNGLSTNNICTSL